MAVTILDLLHDAKLNLCDRGDSRMARMEGRTQLINALMLLDKGYPLDTPIDALIDEYGRLAAVPHYASDQSSV